MLFSIAFALMLISSIVVILYVNYFTASKQKEMQKLAAQDKFRKPLQLVSPQEDDKQVLVEAV